MKLPYTLKHQKAKPPKFAHDDDACFDLTACTRKPLNARSMLYDTGVAFEIPDGYHIKVYSRSGHGFKYDIRLCNSTGIIDAGYRDTIKVKLTYDGPVSYRPDWPYLGDRIAQAMLVKNVKTDLVQVDGIDTNTERGENGLGSTGN